MKMKKNYIRSDLEFFDVISAFPALKEILILKNINIREIKEGVTVYEFLKAQLMTEKEIETFIRKLNIDLNNYLCEGTCNVLEPVNLGEEHLLSDDMEKIEEEE